MEFVTKTFIVLATVLLPIFGTEAAVPRIHRIVGGAQTRIEQYPFMVSVLGSGNLQTFTQTCAGTILNERSVLSAAHCLRDSPDRFRVRVGSTYANSGGTVHNVQRYTNHPDFRWITVDNDISIVRTATAIVFADAVQASTLAGANYILQDNEPVQIAGWGRLSDTQPASEDLRHTFIWTVNHQICRNNYAELGYAVTDNMICAGWIHVGGRGSCAQDSGGPLLHHNANTNGLVVVGVTSLNNFCGHHRYFGIYTRVSRYISWIQITV